MRRGIPDADTRWMRLLALVVAVVLLSACGPRESGAPATARPSSSPSAPASSSAASSGPVACVTASASSDVPVAGRQLGVLHFVDKNYGWIASGVGPDLRVVRTVDGGATWSSGARSP